MTMMMTAYEHGQNAAHSRRYALRDMRPERAERLSMHGLNRRPAVVVAR